MPYSNPNVVNASLQLTAAAALDYSTLLVVDCNHLSSARTAIYTEMPSSSVIPSDTDLYKALTSAFSASVRPDKVVAARGKGTATITPNAIVAASDYSFTITVDDGETQVVSHTLGGGEDQEDLATAWKVIIDSNTDITDHVTATVVGTGAAAVLTIALVTGADDFVISSMTDTMTAEGTLTEAPADSIDEIKNFNKDWTVIAATDHTPSYQISMASVAVVQQKPYFTSTALAESYATWDGVSTPDSNDVPALFKSTANNYAHCTYHEKADNFPECVRFTQFSHVKPGESAFQYKVLSGYKVAQILGGTRPLNSTELANLEAKDCSTVVNVGGTPVVVGNRMASDIRIEAITFMLYTRQELQRGANTLFLNINKMGMNDIDIGRISNAWTSFLDRNVSSAAKTKALDPYLPYTVSLPLARDVSFSDRVNGILTADVTLYLDASIDSTVLNLTLTYRDPSQA